MITSDVAVVNNRGINVSGGEVVGDNVRKHKIRIRQREQQNETPGGVEETRRGFGRPRRVVSRRARSKNNKTHKHASPSPDPQAENKQHL